MLILITNRKVNKMNNQDKNNVVYDNISGYGITVINDEMYLVLNNNELKKLDALIIKEKREEN